VFELIHYPESGDTLSLEALELGTVCRQAYPTFCNGLPLHTSFNFTRYCFCGARFLVKRITDLSLIQGGKR
jgi:hypothetical protein